MSLSDKSTDDVMGNVDMDNLGGDYWYYGAQANYFVEASALSLRFPSRACFKIEGIGNVEVYHLGGILLPAGTVQAVQGTFIKTSIPPFL